MEEIWKSHENFENYEFSNYGRFRKADTQFILKNTVDSTKGGGYIITFIKNAKTGKRQRLRIHRMIAMLFVHNPNPSEYNIINHIDGNKTNNHYTNLEWSTILKNNQHAWINGLCNASSKLDNDTVTEIRLEYINNSDITYKDLAQKYSVNVESIKAILRYKTRPLTDEHLKHNCLLTVKQKEKLQLENHKKLKEVKPEIINEILNDYVNGLTKNKLITKYGYTHDKINKIIQNNSLPNINILEGEIFKQYTKEYNVSNMGRISLNGVIKYKNKEFTINAIARTFIPNPNNIKHPKLIDKTKPITIDNIEWHQNNDYFDEELFEELKIKLKTEQIKLLDFKKKYNVKEKMMVLLKKEVSFHLRPKNIICVKKHLCKKCGDTNPENFKDRNKSSCKACVKLRSYRYIKKPKKQHSCTICGDTNPENFKGGNKGCCSNCHKIKYKK